MMALGASCPVLVRSTLNYHLIKPRSMNRSIVFGFHNLMMRGLLHDMEILASQHPWLISHISPSGGWLHVAAESCSMEVVDKLIELGVDLDLRAGIFNSNSLKSAASAGRMDMVKHLVEHGVSIDNSHASRSPLYSAVHNCNIAMVDYLITHGADVSAVYLMSGVEMNAVDYAAERGCLDVVSYFKARGFSGVRYKSEP